MGEHVTALEPAATPLPARTMPLEATMSTECDRSDDPSQRCGFHHPTETTNIIGSKNCCCGTPWLSPFNRCGTGALEDDVDKTYLECLHLELRALRADLNAREQQSHEGAQ